MTGEVPTRTERPRFDVAVRDVVPRLREGPRRESRRRRVAWVAVAALLVLVPVAFNLNRQSSFTASVELYPVSAGPYTPIRDPAWYRRLLGDPDLRLQMRPLLARAGFPEYGDVSLHWNYPHTAMILSGTADTPDDARAFVRALGLQIAGATGRRLAGRVGIDLNHIAVALRARPIHRAVARRLVRQQRELLALLQRAPGRVVNARRVDRPRLTRWADRVADAMPGAFPPRPAIAWAAVSGLFVAAALWAIGLLLFPPGAPAALSLRGLLGGRAARPRAPPRPRPRAAAAADGHPVQPLPPPATRLPRWGRIAGAVVLAGVGLFVLWAGRGAIFLGDEWAFVVDRRGGGLDSYLQPQNEQLVLLPVVAFKALFATVGLDHYQPYRVAIALAHLGCVALVFTIARRRVGTLPAALLSAPILAFGPGWQAIMSPINLGFLGSVLGGLGAMLALDRGTRRGDRAACGLLGVSLASSGLGLCFALGAAVEVLWGRDRRERAWIVVAPLFVFAAWHLGFNLNHERAGPLQPDRAPEFAFRAASDAFTSLFGLPLGVETAGRGYHRALELLSFAAFVAVAAVLTRRLRRSARLTPRVAMLLTTLLSFWLLAGVARAYTHQWYAGRYVYPAGVLILVLLAELVRGVRLGRRAIALAAGLAILAAALNANWLVEGGDRRRADSEILAARLGAVELARWRILPTYGVDAERANSVLAKDYFAATDDLGSPAMSPDRLARASRTARASADSVLASADLRILRFRADPGRSPTRVRLTGSAARFAKRRNGCLSVRPPAGLQVSARLTLPVQGIVLRARRGNVVVRVRRYGSTYLPPTQVLTSRRRPQLILALPDLSSRPWIAKLQSSRPFRIC